MKHYRLTLYGKPFGKRISYTEVRKTIRQCQYCVLGLGYQNVKRRESA